MSPFWPNWIDARPGCTRSRCSGEHGEFVPAVAGVVAGDRDVAVLPNLIAAVTTFVAAVRLIAVIAVVAVVVLVAAIGCACGQADGSGSPPP